MKQPNLRLAEECRSAAVSGSFHRHMEAINAAVQQLASLSVQVLSPADPRVVASQGEFLFVASDRVRSVRVVQDRHLECIRAADFLWLVCPDGYVGQSASMEVGFAAAAGVPIFSTHSPSDLTLRQYVMTVSTIRDALRTVATSGRPRRCSSLLIDPHASVEEAHQVLEQIEVLLTHQSSIDDLTGRLSREASALRKALRMPLYAQ